MEQPSDDISLVYVSELYCQEKHVNNKAMVIQSNKLIMDTFLTKKNVVTPRVEIDGTFRESFLNSNLLVRNALFCFFFRSLSLIFFVALISFLCISQTQWPRATEDNDLQYNFTL